MIRCNLFGNRGAWHCKNVITETAPLSVWVIWINRSLDCKFTYTSTHKKYQRYIIHWNLFGNRGRDTAITKIPYLSKSQRVIVSPNRAYGRLQHWGIVNTRERASNQPNISDCTHAVRLYCQAIARLLFTNSARVCTF